jgi:polysaccharide export outer membrane protein
MNVLIHTCRRANWIGLAICLILSGGCQVLEHQTMPVQQPAYCSDIVVKPWIPRELDKVTVPMYRVEPPDILTIDVVQQIAQSSYSLQMGDMLALTVTGTFPDEPISGDYPIETGGVVELGYSYGAVELAGNTVEEATHLLETHLQKQLRDPNVTLSIRSVTGFQPIAGEHLVGPDGTVTLGQYGSVSVVGQTLNEVRETIAEHLSEYFANPQVSVSVYAFNSKVYYIITQGGGLGDGLVRLPHTGSETVMDALSHINGLSYASSNKMWIARPDRCTGTSQILPIDWEAVSQCADVHTNYQLLPGDRLYVAEDRLVAFDGAIAKITSPFERIFGFTLLGTGTVARLSGKVLDNFNQVGGSR